MLAFMEDTLLVFPHNSQEVNAKSTTVRNRRRRQQQQRISAADLNSQKQSLEKFLGECSLVVLFFLDEAQSHCIRLRDALLQHEIQQRQQKEAQQEDLIRVVCVSPKSLESIDTAILQHTGFGLTRPTAALNAILNISHVPTLVVLRDGRKISKSCEELTLEWNTVQENLDAWKEGRSGLTMAQQVQSLACTIL